MIRSDISFEASLGEPEIIAQVVDSGGGFKAEISRPSDAIRRKSMGIAVQKRRQRRELDAFLRERFRFVVRRLPAD